MLRRLTALLIVLAGAAPALAVAARKLRVRGPDAVRVGQEVKFPTRGFKPHEQITVNLDPTIHRGGNCCGIDVIKGARADSHGEAILHFRWPAYYFNGPDKVRFLRGQRVDVLVLTPAYARGRKVVTVR